MMRMEHVTAHGGQGAVAGSIHVMPEIHAIVRPAWGVIRVWQGHAPHEDFTFAEARDLCAAADKALRGPFSDGGAFLAVEADVPALRIKRGWLVGFLAAMRKALRTLDAAHEMAGAAH